LKSKPRLLDKKTTHIVNCVFGKDVVIAGNVTLANCEIGDGVHIFPMCEISGSVIGDGSYIRASFIENSTIGKNNQIGPFARIRPNSTTHDNVKIGNFVEVKNSELHSGVKANHLAYIGDSEIGQNTNIGCGAIFVNYNGRIKQRCKVGKNCFIGSNVNVIAPIEISDGSYICAGTTITDNTEIDDFVIGRVIPTIKAGRAKEYRKEE